MDQAERRLDTPYDAMRALLSALETGASDHDAPIEVLYILKVAQGRAHGNFERPAQGGVGGGLALDLLAHRAVTCRIVRAVAYWAGAEAVEAIRARLRTEMDSDFREALFEALRLIGGPLAVAELLSWAEESPLPGDKRLVLRQIRALTMQHASLGDLGSGCICLSNLAIRAWKEHRPLLLGTDAGMLLARIEAVAADEAMLVEEVASALEDRLLGVLVREDHEAAERMIAVAVAADPCQGDWVKRIAKIVKRADM